jgi:hypothetical protein
MDDGDLHVRDGELAALYEPIEDGGEEGEELRGAEFAPCGAELGEPV